MKKTKRQVIYESKPVCRDVICEPDIDFGLVGMNSPNDPKPGIKIENGTIVEMDHKTIDEFDFIDKFIARYGINIASAEKNMKINSTEIARKLVDINVSREELKEICSGLTPAKLQEVVSQMNVVEIMMAQMKMRARKTPANQAHVVNIADNPILMAADAAEAALRGFSEQETTCTVARMAPLNALSLMVGSPVGKPGVITQCSLEEASELRMGMKGLTSYAETVSVYGSESVMTDGDDTPWSKAFLASAYASRGLKMRFSSGSASEVMMGDAGGQSMLYLEIRCIWLAKAAGAQGIQNGSVDGLPISSAMPAGLRAVAAENLITSMLGLEVASGNDTFFSHSLARTESKMMLSLLPGTDLITSGFGSVPNSDSTFAGSSFDCDDYPNFYMLQRDMQVDGGIIPVDFADVVTVRAKAVKALQVVYEALNFPEITDEEVEAAVYAYSSADMPERSVADDIKAGQYIMDSDFNGFDVVKVLHENGYEDVAENVLNMLKQKLAGDYLHVSAVFDYDFSVLSAVNDSNDYRGPGSGYRIDEKRWTQLKNNMNAVAPRSYFMESKEDEKLIIRELGDAQKGSVSDEVVVALSPSFGREQVKSIREIPHFRVIRELSAGIEEEGLKARFIKCYNSSDLAVIAHQGAKLSGSGIAIGIQSRGTAVITQKDLEQLDNLELFSLSPNYTEETFRQIGKNAAKYAKKENVEPQSASCDMSVKFYMLKSAILHNHETGNVIKNKPPAELEILIKEDGDYA